MSEERTLVVKNGQYEAFQEGAHVVVYESDTDNEVARIDLEDAGASGLGNFLAHAVEVAKGLVSSSTDSGSGAEIAGGGA